MSAQEDRDYFRAEFEAVRLNNDGFDFASRFQTLLSLEDRKNQKCLEQEIDENCLRALGHTTFEAVSDARIILGLKP